MKFKNRQEAGKKLAEKLATYRHRPDVLVLALPRGGVVAGVEVAAALEAPLDIVAPRKIGAPGNHEYAIGALTETGETVFNEAERARVDPQWLAKEIKKEQTEAERRLKTYRGDRPPLELKGKTVILVDDGMATGLTMAAAIASVRRRGAAKIIVAVPVSAQDSLLSISRQADETVVLETPVFFGSVGAWYESFPQVSDEEVTSSISLLK